MNLPTPTPILGKDFDPLATSKELGRLVVLQAIYRFDESERDSLRQIASRIDDIHFELGMLLGLEPHKKTPPEAQHNNILREGPSPENPTEGGQDQMSFFDSIPD